MTPSAEALPPDQTPAGEPLHRALGLTDDEFEAVGKILGRAPNHLELALYAVMWSEHCSYKSSRLHLRRLPTEGPRVLVGPGENAGVIDAGDGIAVAIRIESHNHPSAIEPYQGAATGVGGILRDIFTMGARPLAVMDPLFFGSPDDARQRWLVEGVVSGISGYGNSVGVPTVGGELTFDPCYAQNPLVNVLCMGALPVERLVLGIASGPGNLAVLLGSSTGRDGIGGVSVLASAGFSGDDAGAADDTKRPSVQVGDPFEEKRLIEACLELLDTKLVVGIQDLGGAGLACATSETAGRGGVGMDVDVSAVPRREEGMEPWEVMTSESQERMLAIVTPESWPAVAAICAKWEVRATVVGTVMEPEPGGGGRLRIRDGMDGPVLADVPAASLSDDAPLYDRPRQAPVRARDRAAGPAHRLRRRSPGAAALAGLGLPPVRPPALPQHRGRAGRRRRAAPPGRPRAAAVGPRRGADDGLQPAGLRARPAGRHRARPGRGRRQPGLRRCDAGRRRELPELREPRAPRGHVAALRVHRRHGRVLPRPRRSRSSAGTSASTTRAAGPTSTRRRCSGCSASSTPSTRRRPGWPGPPATPSSWSGRAPRRTAPSPWRGRAGPPSAGTTAPGGSRPSTSRRTARPVPSWPGWSPRRSPAATASRWCTPSTTCRAGDWPWRWPRWPRRREPGARWTSTMPPSSSPSCPRASWWRRAIPTSCCRRAAAGGIPAAVLGPAGGARCTLGGLVDLPVDALREAHEGNLALALGEP